MAAKTTAVDLDQVIHERRRLGIVSALAVNDRLSFRELKTLLNLTDGNLSVHARKLEEAGYIKVSKAFSERKPRTEYGLTAIGRRALQTYLTQMEGIMSTTRDGLAQ